jgi:hypothetical protein
MHLNITVEFPSTPKGSWLNFTEAACQVVLHDVSNGPMAPDTPRLKVNGESTHL